MANIELVIKIPEEVYEEYKGKRLDRWNHSQLAIYIANGKPLPKGHGRLIDADAVLDEVHRCLEERDYTLGSLYDNLCELPTIIEADKESEDT